MKKGSEESIMPPLLLALMDYTCVLLGLVSWFPCFFVSFSQDNLDRIKKKKRTNKNQKDKSFLPNQTVVLCSFENLRGLYEMFWN